MKRPCAFDTNQGVIFFEQVFSQAELVKNIFKFTPFLELSACACVCKQWQQSTLDRDIWPDISSVGRVKVFDASEWKKIPGLTHYGISVDDEPELDKRKFLLTLIKIDRIMKSSSLAIEGWGNKATLLTIPKGLSYEYWNQFLTSNPRYAYDIFYDPGFSDLEVEKTYRILITNSILKNSQGPYEQSAPEKYLEIFCGSRLPKAREIQVLNGILFFIGIDPLNIPSNIISDERFSFTYCKEDAAQLQPGAAGLYEFDDERLSIRCSREGRVYAEDDPNDEDIQETYGTGFVYEM